MKLLPGVLRKRAVGQVANQHEGVEVLAVPVDVELAGGGAAPPSRAHEGQTERGAHDRARALQALLARQGDPILQYFSNARRRRFLSAALIPSL